MTISKAGLRAVTIGTLVVALSLLVALLAQGGLFSEDPGLPGHPDGLTTLALVLAVLAFLIQIFVFVFQTNSANASLRRGEELNAETHAALGKIEANSATTQTVLISQFETLLDFVVGRPAASKRDSDGAVGEEAEEGVEAIAAEDETPLTLADLRRALSESSRPRERPTFEAPAGRIHEPSGEDLRMIQYLQAWPERAEVEASVTALQELSPIALVVLTRYGVLELQQRSNGRRVGLRTTQKGPSEATRHLIDVGLVRRDGDRAVLTDRGRELVRCLPIGKWGNERPEWYDEALAPLSSPIGGGSAGSPAD